MTRRRYLCRVLVRDLFYAHFVPRKKTTLLSNFLKKIHTLGCTRRSLSSALLKVARTFNRGPCTHPSREIYNSTCSRIFSHTGLRLRRKSITREIIRMTSTTHSTRHLSREIDNWSFIPESIAIDYYCRPEISSCVHFRHTLVSLVEPTSRYVLLAKSRNHCDEDGLLPTFTREFLSISNEIIAEHT